jgi:TonB-linked SusC/RagA family outer membrane protein
MKNEIFICLLLVFASLTAFPNEYECEIQTRSTVVSQQQEIKVKGSVSDEKGIPLPGVSIAVKGTTQGTITDSNGDFSLTVSSEAVILRISFVGYQTQEITVGKQRLIAVTLKEDVAKIDEVTIVAFGKQKKESVIASVDAVDIQKLKIHSSNLTTAFAGKIPGLISYQTSGEPGADNAQFFVRGVTTFGYKASPLILIDGFEVTSEDLARLQPDDIEGFSILKDASAAALYGARGANGIITVSTKSGREGPVRMNARIDVNVATPTQMLDLLDGVEYMKMYNQAYMSSHPQMGTWYDMQKIQSTSLGENPMIYPNINWYDALFKNSTVNTKGNINLEGGGKKATYYVAVGIDHETGLLKVDNLNNFNNNIDIKRFNIRNNVIFKLTPTTTLDTRVQGRFEKYNGPFRSASEIFAMVMDANPVDFPAKYEPDDAHLYSKYTLFGNTLTSTGGLKANPYAEMVRGYDNRDVSTITAMATLMQDLDFVTQGLKFQAKASVNTWSYYSGRRTFEPYYYSLEKYNQITGEYSLYNLNPTTGNSYLGDVIPVRDASAHYYYEGRLNWDRKYGRHSIGLMTVGIAEEFVLTAGNSTSIYETLPERNLGNSGRFTYDYDSRYFFEFDYGYNGSEKFRGKNQFGFFPSMGVAWLASNEPYWNRMKDAISLLKLKFTWGKVGNDAITQLRSDRFFYLSSIQAGGYLAGYQFGTSFTNAYPGYTILRYANPDISWEVSEKINLGLELGLFKDESLNFQIDLFREVRDKIYWERQNIPATVGLETTTISGNIGKVRSKGFDASIDYKHSFNNNLWMTGRANITYSTNKILEIDEKNYKDEYLKRVGHNVNQSWGLIAERLFVDDEEVKNSPEQAFGSYTAGDIKYMDINDDGVVNDNDRVAMGYPLVPEIQYGFGLSMGYKKFDFSFFFQGNARVSFYINPAGIAPFVNRRNAPAVVAKGAWSETNQDVHAFWPRLSTELMNNNIQQSSWWIRDGSFLRLKSVEMGWTFASFHKIGLQSGRIYLSGENLFVVSPFKLWDPEMGGNGLGYPINRKFNIGIQFTF